MLLANSKIFIRLFVVLSVLSWFTVFISTPYVFGISPEQRTLFDSGIYHYDVDVGSVCAVGSSPQSSGVGGVFYIGDSLTVGMVGSGLLQKTSDAGYTVSPDLSVDTATQKTGASVEATQGYSVSNTIENLAKDTSRFAANKVSIIVVMLGTNPESNQSLATQEMITYIREFNTTAKIYWVNTYTKKSLGYEATNLGIQRGISESGDSAVSIIDFASEAESNDYGFANDGIHHTSDGYGLKSDFVVSSLPGQTGNTAVGDANPTIPPGEKLSNVNLTSYSPQEGGDTVEGGYPSARRGLDGEFLVRTLDDYASGDFDYVTLAADPSFYTSYYIAPTITYINKDDVSKTLTNVRFFVHDTGSAFTGQPEGKFDVPIGKDYPDSIMNKQPFNGENKIDLFRVDETTFNSFTQENTAENTCGGTAPVGTGDNDVDLINALKNSGMTIQQAVGVLANVYHESGNNPKRQECVYSVENGLSKNIPANIMESDGAISSANQRTAAETLIAGDSCAFNSEGRRIKSTADGYGWGLVQWTSAQKIIGNSTEKGVPYELIDSLPYQADFLISQLRGESVGLLINYGVNAGTDEARRNSGFFNTTTAEDAAEFFAINYERCGNCKAGNPEIADRRREAGELFIKYGSL